MPEATHQNNERSHVTKPPGSPSHSRHTSLKVLSRNIDKVVLGNHLFETWYFSPYPENVIFSQDHAQSSKSVNGDHISHKSGHSEKSTAPIIPVLHVCSYCFRYTTSPADYVQHLQIHLNRSEAEGQSWWPVPRTALKVYEWEGYTVWDIDGEQEKLYCQNLSLFAKLFLEQKSVFFDTAGFHYFVLTYSPPTERHSSLSPTTTAKTRGRKRRSSGSNVDLGLKIQVLGFFSKENLSWDANNLACILVFPPYQHRNLGQLLMAVSYKLSGWEWEDSVIGGPEKPLSSMGRKAYVRFWSERVARFFMGMTADAEGERVFSRVKKGRKAAIPKETMTVKEIGDRTGMLAEDVVAALNEMGLCMPQKRSVKKLKQEDGKADDETTMQGEEEVPTTMLVKRSEVLAWAETYSADLISPVKEEGFLGEWALSESGDENGADSGSDESDVEVADTTE